MISLSYLVNNSHAETLNFHRNVLLWVDLNQFSSDRIFDSSTQTHAHLQLIGFCFSNVCVYACAFQEKKRTATLHIWKFTVYTFDFYLSCVSNLYILLLFLLPLSFTNKNFTKTNKHNTHLCLHFVFGRTLVAFCFTSSRSFKSFVWIWK